MFRSYAAVVVERPELVIRSNRSVKIAKQVDRSASENDRERVAGDAVLGLAATSLIQSVGQEFRLDWVAVRSTPCASVGKGFTGCGAECRSL